jgi:hypothetical protein
MNQLKYWVKNLYTVFGIVLIWRGIWYLLDIVDKQFFSGGHVGTALFGIAFGLFLIYFHDHDLKEIEKM